MNIKLDSFFYFSNIQSVQGLNVNSEPRQRTLTDIPVIIKFLSAATRTKTTIITYFQSGEMRGLG